MKSIGASVTGNVLASLAAIVLFGMSVLVVAGPQQNHFSVRQGAEKKLLLADGPTPVPQWPLPPPKSIV
jgi:hypothetical protein